MSVFSSLQATPTTTTTTTNDYIDNDNKIAFIINIMNDLVISY